METIQPHDHHHEWFLHDSNGVYECTKCGLLARTGAR